MSVPAVPLSTIPRTSGENSGRARSRNSRRPPIRLPRSPMPSRRSRGSCSRPPSPPPGPGECSADSCSLLSELRRLASPPSFCMWMGSRSDRRISRIRLRLDSDSLEAGNNEEQFGAEGCRTFRKGRKVLMAKQRAEKALLGISAKALRMGQSNPGYWESKAQSLFTRCWPESRILEPTIPSAGLSDRQTRRQTRHRDRRRPDCHRRDRHRRDRGRHPGCPTRQWKEIHRWRPPTASRLNPRVPGRCCLCP